MADSLDGTANFVNGIPLFSVSAAALELAYLACGGTEGFVCLGLNEWDYAAGVLLVKEAGGKITDFLFARTRR